jgi:uncharacterized membrane protein
LLLTFAIVVMPGIAKLDNREFMRAFQVIDRVIQNNQPVFMFVWVGSVLTLVTTAILGFWQLPQTDRLLILAAAAVYLLGVQLPTVRINLPLNNQLQRLDLTTRDETVLKSAREDFEAPWNRSNRIRTGCALVTSVLLLLALLRV